MDALERLAVGMHGSVAALECGDRLLRIVDQYLASRITTARSIRRA